MSYEHGSNNPLQAYTCHECHRSVRGGPCPDHGPMQQPFVGVFDVGQGNCNAIVGADGKVHAYYDFGRSTAGHRQPDPPANPCLCDDPLVILSHLDKDHYQLAWDLPQALTMRWLMPDQAHSGLGTTLKNDIADAGGEVVLWPKDLAHGQVRPRSMVFPWGYVERCTGDATNKDKANSSGLAAFVCVQDSRGKSLGNPGAPAATQPDPPATSAVAERAKSVRPLIQAAVNGQIPGPLNRAWVTKLAKPVGVMLAMSQTIAGRQPHLPVGHCATAAAIAATGVFHGANKAAIVAALNHSMPGLEAKGWAAAVYGELADAALAAATVRSQRRRCLVAAQHLTWDAAVNPRRRAEAAQAALRPARHALPPIVEGTGKFKHGQKFVLLNGDADFAFIPSMRRTRRRPEIVAMTAMHHGAIYECGETLSSWHLPIAPTSRAALAVARFSRPKAARSLVAAASEAAVALLPRRTRHSRRNVRPHVTNVARAAAAAVLCIEAAYPGESSYNEVAAGAAAAALAAWKYGDSQIVGLATALAAFVYSIADDVQMSPVETAVDLAAAAIEGERAAASLTRAQIQELSLGILPTLLIGHVANLAADAITHHAAALNPQHAGDVAAMAVHMMVDSHKNGVTKSVASRFRDKIGLYAGRDEVLNDAATAAVACLMVPRNRHNLPARTQDCLQQAWNSLGAGFAGGWNPGTLVARVSNVLGSPGGARPGGVDDFAIVAANWAAERAAGYLCTRPAEDVCAVIRCAGDRSRRHEVASAVGRRGQRRYAGGQIAYSYGVSSADSSHEYQVGAGDLGHAHPCAITKYEAMGWTRRYNASRRARHAGAQGDPDRGHPAGPVGLQWDATRRDQLQRGRVQHRCGSCGGTKPFNG